MSLKRQSAGPAKKKIFIVDDHPMMRDGLAQMIANESDLSVCGDAENASEALERMEKLRPDLALVDITLRSGSGLELIKDLQARLPTVAVLVISMHDESLYAERVLRAGGRGYIMKQEGGKKLMEAIRQVLNGQTYISPTMSAKIVDAFAGRRSGRPTRSRHSRFNIRLHFIGFVPMFIRAKHPIYNGDEAADNDDNKQRNEDRSNHIIPVLNCFTDLCTGRTSPSLAETLLR